MQLLPLILFGIATAFSPGPNNIMTSYTAFNFGFRKAIPTMLGVIIGWTLLIILLQLTSGAIFQKYAFIQTTIKILGSIYLLYMAYKLSFASFIISSDAFFIRALNSSLFSQILGKASVLKPSFVFSGK